MKLAKYLMPLSVLLGMGRIAYGQEIGQETSFERNLNLRDDQPVREFVESKENIDVKQKASDLEISGDVRFEWRSIQEKGIRYFTRKNVDDLQEDELPRLHKKYAYLRGGDVIDEDGLPVSTNDFDVEFNLKFKYTFKRAWAMGHLQFDNPAGVRRGGGCLTTFPVFNKDGTRLKEDLLALDRYTVKGSGEALFINLKRAYLGYNIWADGAHRLDIEFGRRKLNDVFDSEVQFTSRFDGILLKFASAIEETFDWYVDAAAFVIDERVNHFGYVAEIGMLNLFDTGLDLRYNIIDWRKHGRNRCFVHDPLGTSFLNSEITLTYNVTPTFGETEVPLEFYGGFLVNHAAKKTRFTKGMKKNLAWYAGLYIGEVIKEGDWSIDIEYVVVQAQAVPDLDVGSIGRGNILDTTLYEVVTAAPRVGSQRHYYFVRSGNANFRGWRVEGLYAITDNFSIDIAYESSYADDARIGGPHRYSDFEIEAIYAF